jgi:tRNA-splicing endonuclease subunit Sen15
VISNSHCFPFTRQHQLQLLPVSQKTINPVSLGGGIGVVKLGSVEMASNTSASQTQQQLDHVQLHKLAESILYNLEYQHDWTVLSIHTTSTITNLPLSRPMISGLPPKRVYIHPDEQVEVLKAEHEHGEKIPQIPEREWVLPTYLYEKFSLATFAKVYDSIETVPEGARSPAQNDSDLIGHKWQNENRQKRILLATVHNDSTVVYYIMHDGTVKPRQN